MAEGALPAIARCTIRALREGSVQILSARESVALLKILLDTLSCLLGDRLALSPVVAHFWLLSLDIALPGFLFVRIRIVIFLISFFAGIPILALTTLVHVNFETVESVRKGTSY